jgi:obg-like ATPase 1
VTLLTKTFFFFFRIDACRILIVSLQPSILLCNMTPDDYIRKKNKWLPKLAAWAKEHGNLPLLPFSAALEQKLETMTAEQLKAWQEEHKSVSAIPRIVTTGFKSMHLIYFFTAGTDEVKAWTVTKGFRAPQAAGVIHTDFEKGFICADVYNYEDFVACGADEQKVKDAGKMRQQGRNYLIRDGDIIFFKFNRPSAGKK